MVSFSNLCSKCKNYNQHVNKCFLSRYTLDKSIKKNICETNIKLKVKQGILHEFNKQSLENEFATEYDYYTIHDKKINQLKKN